MISELSTRRQPVAFVEYWTSARTLQILLHRDAYAAGVGDEAKCRSRLSAVVGRGLNACVRPRDFLVGRNRSAVLRGIYFEEKNGVFRWTSQACGGQRVHAFAIRRHAVDVQTRDLNTARWELVNSARRTQIDALKPCALISNVRLVMVNEIPSITRLIKPYLPTKLSRTGCTIVERTETGTPYGSTPLDAFCTSRSCSQVSISTVTSSNCYEGT